MTHINETTLNELVGRVLGDLGGAVSVPLVRIGDTLGLYTTLKEVGPASAEELAAAAGCAPAMYASGCRRRQRLATFATKMASSR